MKMTLSPWPEVAAELQSKLGYVGGQEYDMADNALLAIIAGFDVQVRHLTEHKTKRQARESGPPKTTLSVQVSPGGRGFGQR